VTLDQLRVFVAVAERQHVTQAARALNLAQSAASAAIAALEGQHGVRLFHRVGRGIELTETGRLFLVEARSVLARSAAAELALAELGGLRRGTLLVQASQTISSYWLPRHLVAFRRAHPGVEVRLQVGNTAQVAAAVHEGAAELGFVKGVVRDPMLTSTTVARDQLIVVVAPGHPWAECRTIECAELPDSAWVLREPGSGTRSAFEAALEGFGISRLFYGLRWNCRPTKRSGRRWRPGQGPPQSPHPSWPGASRLGCCIGRFSTCRIAISMCCATRSVIEAARGMR